jgi:D-alanyl-D-alanine carboxypeptidase/D-alanyl-D-alanine-endopeptidase (penicillin-binding protein 4)
MRSLRRVLTLAIVPLILLAVVAPSVNAASPRWIRRIDTIVAGHPISVMIGNDGEAWYRHGAAFERPPASNEKLLLSMALFDRLGPGRTFQVRAMASNLDAGGTIANNLWLRGQGDPEVSDIRLARLAQRIKDAGVDRIEGRVIGVTGPFQRDWFAPGWKSYFPRDYIALPTALTFQGNSDADGVHIADPERRAAAYLTRRLRALGVSVAGKPGAGTAPTGLSLVATITSQPMRTLVQHMDMRSINFSAEVLGKALAMDRGDSGSIANAAAAICGYEAAHGVAGTCYDSSGLSYANRQTAAGIVRMLWVADRQPWAGTLRMSLPDGGQGTLKGRLAHVRVRAKTGTLINASALSGWVWSNAAGTWIEFSLLTSGMNEYAAKDLEDRIVYVLAANARDPAP